MKFVLRSVLVLVTATMLVGSFATTASAQTVRTEKRAYAPSESIVVFYHAFPGFGRDWVTIVPVGTRADRYAQTVYTGGSSDGSLRFNGLSAGEYEVRGYFNWPKGGYNIRARSAFSVIGGGRDRDRDDDRGRDRGHYADFSGRWETNFGRMQLTQRGGGHLNGTYRDGSIDATVNGKDLTGWWTENGGRSHGWFRMTMSADGQYFRGAWGRGRDGRQEGEWNGRR